MRLTPNEVLAIKEAIEKKISLQHAELRLFGSRTKDNLKGGDIDLLLIVPDKTSYQEVALKKVSILIEIQNRIGEQKIDLTLATKDDLKSDPFVKLIFPSSLVLHSWKN